MINKKSLKNLKPGGVVGNKGGSGRPPEWLKAKCAKIIDRKKVVEFLGEVVGGEDVETVISFDSKGKKVRTKVPADVRDRIRAAEILLERGFGKVALPVGDGDDGLARLADLWAERYK